MSQSNADAPLHLAVVIDQRLRIGGGFQQSLNAALLASRLQLPGWTVTCFTLHRETVGALAELGIQATRLPSGWLHSLSMALRRPLRGARLMRWTRQLFGPNGLERALERHAVDLVYFVAPSALARDLERTNFIVTVWDLCHRDAPEFPEVRDDREFERRERYYSEVLPKAVAVFVDSEIGTSNVVRRYAIDADRVHVMRSSPAPHTPDSDTSPTGQIVDIKSSYGVDGDYIFYPAQFWAHKNHVYIVRALRLLQEQHGVRLHAIFAGGDAGGTLAHVRALAQAVGLGDCVHFAGFVPGRHIPELYRQALALVMPTYFGPTNLPPLEALKYGTPVLYPGPLARAGGLEGIVRAIDLDNPATLADQLLQLHRTFPVVAERRPDPTALALLARLDDDSERIAVLSTVLSGYANRRRCWA